VRAAVVPRHGPAEVIEVRDDWPEPDPPRPGEVLVAVQAAGLNPSDTKIRAGGGRLGDVELPYVSGREATGWVVEVGPGVDSLEPGQGVFAFFGWGARPGGHTERLVVSASALALCPLGVPVEEAAGLPLAGLTALQGLEALGALAGERVLVTSGSGGVGHLGVQIAVALGLEVIATSGPANLGFVSGLGAAEVLDYRDEDHRRRLRGIPYVLDSVGAENIGSYLGCLSAGAKVAAVAGVPSEVPDGITVTPIRCEASSARLTRLSGLMTEGRLSVTVQQVFPLEQAAEAHRLLEGGHVRGKLVIAVGA
jgi:NADPH:quinone reductase-like Zn-dependent oxidoreductase